MLGTADEALIGKIVGRWTVISAGRRTKSRNQLMICKCACGRSGEVSAWRLRTGQAESCGCLTKEKNTKHGYSAYRNQAAEYRIWRAMWDRCTNPKLQNWKWYGGQGVTVCDRWRDFSNFIHDVGKMPAPRMWLDRINGGNYEPGNVRWATCKQQQRNRSNNRIIEFEGQSLCLSEWAEKYRIKPWLLRQRLLAGWTIHRSLNTPARRAGRAE